MRETDTPTATCFGYRCSRRCGQSTLEQSRKTAREGRRVGQLLTLDNPRLVEKEPGKFRKLIRGTGLTYRRSEALDELVTGVQLKDALGHCVELAVLLQQPLKMHVHVALVGNEANGAVGQAIGAAHVLHRVAERQLEYCNQARKLGRRLRLLVLAVLGRGDSVKIDAAAGRRLERLVFIGTDRRHPKLVDRVCHQQYLHATRAKAFELRAPHGDVEIV